MGCLFTSMVLQGTVRCSVNEQRTGYPERAQGGQGSPDSSARPLQAEALERGLSEQGPSEPRTGLALPSLRIHVEQMVSRHAPVDEAEYIAPRMLGPIP